MGIKVRVELSPIIINMSHAIRIGRRRRQNQDGIQGPTQGPSVGKSSTLRVRGGLGNEQFARTEQEIGRPEIAEPSDPKKAYGIERLKKLGVTVFEGSTDPADVENWLNMLEKYFNVMNFREERKLSIRGRPERAEHSDPEKAYGIERPKKLGATVFEGSTNPVDVENWLNMLEKRKDARALDWQTFKGIFEDKYYPNTYCKAKRDEFLGLKQGSLSVTDVML
ncbi:uncharacterized protein E5676_scaffold1737G00360 [Cucumis melo var. makuwa]|uniref:Retrotransposon gag domain-containing protein n=1 Tax=Cucumis melo var. makuwa TaxID=1194695 RepID=A0A5D3C901_CUCMM|nr:uncharacterized protein E6C27_scaffold673G001520 [Cucumis melo var. makuwa]TYK07762.1 uncharacterized protein E5676_scaffold1737G00360 [Cucumis melo var. makuwa]